MTKCSAYRNNQASPHRSLAARGDHKQHLPKSAAIWLLGTAAALCAADPALSQVPASASAQSGADNSKGGVLNNDIIVTASRRRQSAQSVGISITAMSGKQLNSLGIVNSVDVARIAPNVSVSGSFGGFMSQFVIRGVTQNDYNDHVESVIAAYIDDTYIAMQQGQTFSMFDLDRVEVLKGPQGTLFGRNATGGVVSFFSRRPTDKFEGFADLTYASYNDARFEGAVSGPLANGVDARLSGLFERFDGFLKNKYPDKTFTTGGRPLGGVPAKGAGADLGGIKSNVALRGQITADLAPGTELWVSGFYNHFIGSSAAYQSTPNTVAILDPSGNQIETIVSPPTNICEVIQSGCVPGPYETSPTRPVPGGTYFGYKDPDGKGLVTSSDYSFDDGSRTQTYGASAKLTGQLGFGKLTWISDYKKYSKNFIFDVTGGPDNSFIWRSTAKERTMSQELRLEGSASRLQWLVGAYYLNIHNHNTSGVAALPTSVYATAGVGYDLPRLAMLNSSSYSLFGQVEYKITPEITAIAGLRGSREIKHFTLNDLFVPTTSADDPKAWTTAGGISLGSYSARTAETLWNWKLQLDWKPSRDLLIYAGATQGAKAGSFNTGDGSVFANGGAAIPYKPERLISYEVGIKSSLFDHRLRANAAVFYYDYHNYQAARWTGIASLILNADAYLYGFEGDLTGSITPDLEASLSFGYQHNKVKNIPIGTMFLDRETTFAPNVTLSAILRYTYPNDVAGGRMALQLSGNYQSSVWQNLNNFSANKLKGYALLDGRLSWTSSNKRVTVAVFAQNILDHRYSTIGYDISLLDGANLTSPGRPRWIGGNIRYNF